MAAMECARISSISVATMGVRGATPLRVRESFTHALCREPEAPVIKLAGVLFHHVNFCRGQ